MKVGNRTYTPFVAIGFRTVVEPPFLSRTYTNACEIIQNFTSQS